MKNIITHGIKDEEFIRDEVPMTKEEVREISICKLGLTQNSILYDIGSGTGSISVECAMLSKNIRVFAIETNPDAIKLIKKNSDKFCTSNLNVVEGMAPDAFEKLPVPTHAFIGGSKGNLHTILETLHSLNPSMRVVMNAVSLESISGMTQEIEKFHIMDDEVVQVSISKARKIGSYHMMQANNPVFVFSFTFAGN